jgi:predicted ribosomally synthesized peptide with nif11-like leader
MSEEELTALLAKIKEDTEIQEKLKGAADLDAAIAIAKEAGFFVSKTDWLKYQANQTNEPATTSWRVWLVVMDETNIDVFWRIPKKPLLAGPLLLVR